MKGGILKYLIYSMCIGILFAQKLNLLEPDFRPFDSSPYLTPTSSPTISINISWNTEKEEPTIVAYGSTESLEDTIKIPGLRNHHHVMLFNLLPDAQYYYKVLPGGNLKNFKTFPFYTDSLTFIAFGDTRSDSAAHQSIINGMAKYDFDLLLHSGDFVKDGDNSDDWKTFFNIEDTILQSKHFLPTIGNHEYPFWAYDTLFVLPGAEYFYSINYGNAHFIMLNTEMDLYVPQKNWLVNDLIIANNDPAIDWIFVNLHRPPYSSGSHGSEKSVQNAWCSVFSEHDVDIVFAGHDHGYERTKKINGVIYVVSGGGGAPLYEVGKSDWTIESKSIHHFCLVKIAGRKLSFKAININGKVFDSFVLDKS
jgi:predicted phosphodiesterase